MDMELKMRDNTYNYNKTLDRISEKYSKLSRQSGAKEVNWEHEKLSDVARFISEAELEISRIERESTLIWREYSDGNTKNDSQIEYPAEETHSSINDSIMDGVSEVEQTQASGMDLMDDSQGDLMDGLMQPEDQDEDLERTLSSNGSTLMELYPQMIRKIEKARHREHISEAASSVLRRYRRMRQTDSNARKTTIPKPTPKGENHHLSRSCVKQQPKAEVESSPAVFHSPVRRHPNPPEPLQGWRVQPERQVDPVRSNEKPVLVMDFYSSKPPSPASMNQTFTVSKGSPPCSPLLGKPRRRSFSPAVQPHAQTRGLNRSNLPLVMERSFVPNSPVRPQASFRTKWREWDGYGGSRDTLARHSNAAYLEGYTREAEQASEYPASPSLHKHQHRSPRRTLYQDSHSPSRLRMDSPRSSMATCFLRFPRHNSFDSSLRPGCVTLSPAKIEEEFTNLYHKYVCLGKSPLSDLFPCRCSARRSEANRGSSSSSASALSALALSPYRSLPQKRSSASALSALALSPYRPAPRKRARELDQNKSPMSKRPREWASSLGSVRHSKESRRSLCFSSRDPLSSTRLDILS